MAKRGQTMMYKTLLRKLKIEQHLLFFLCNKCTLKDICETVPVFENKQTNTVAKKKKANRTNNDLQNTTQNTKDRLILNIPFV